MAVTGDRHLAAGDLPRTDVVAFEVLGDALQAVRAHPRRIGSDLHAHLPSQAFCACFCC